MKGYTNPMVGKCDFSQTKVRISLQMQSFITL